MKLLEQYFHKVLFIYLIVLTFESVDETLWWPLPFRWNFFSGTFTRCFCFHHVASILVGNFVPFWFLRVEGFIGLSNNRHVPKTFSKHRERLKEKTHFKQKLPQEVISAFLCHGPGTRSGGQEEVSGDKWGKNIFLFLSLIVLPVRE